MIKLLVKVQREHLEQVCQFKEREPRLLDAMMLLESQDAEEEERLKAEKYVHQVNAEFGVFCGHGDQLTVEVWQEVRVICSQEVTAFGRLEYLAPLQLAGMHTQMNFLAQAFKAHMPNPNNMSDPCTLSRLKARTGKEGIHNDRNRGAEVVVICDFSNCFFYGKFFYIGSW